MGWKVKVISANKKLDFENAMERFLSQNLMVHSIHYDVALDGKNTMYSVVIFYEEPEHVATL